MAPPRTDDSLATILAKLEENSKKEEETRQMVFEVQQYIRRVDESARKLTDEHDQLEYWKPKVEERVTELHTAVTDLKQQIGQVLAQVPPNTIKLKDGTEIGTSASPHLGVPQKAAASGQMCHRESLLHRRLGSGVGDTPMPPPVTGTSSQWVRLATLSFGGPAIFWMQSLDHKVFSMQWEEFGLALSNRFGRDQPKCGERWSHQHRCATTVPLHLVEEMWDLAKEADEDLGSEAIECRQLDITLEHVPEQVLAISCEAVSGSEGCKTIRLRGLVHCQEVLMLLDSGSSASYIGNHMISVMPGIQQLSTPVRVRVADGGILSCNSFIPNCSWFCQGCTFISNLNVLIVHPRCEGRRRDDIILGMNWLETHSPMEIHWGHKSIPFCHKGHQIQLQSIIPRVTRCPVIGSVQLDALIKQEAIEQVLELSEISQGNSVPVVSPSIQKLLEEFAHLFLKPHGLPLRRELDHAIPHNSVTHYMTCVLKGMLSEFSALEGRDHSLSIYQFQWVYVNDLLGIIFSMGLLYSTVSSRSARSSLYGTGWQRSLDADYGVPLIVVLWTALSYSLPSKIPSGIPRRLFTPLPWEPKSLQHWIVVKDLFSVPPVYIFLAIVPAAMVTGLYFFDHSVASRMAQQKEFNLTNPSAYHYDILVLSLMVLICGLLGLPPSNGVLQQFPMHTRRLDVLKKQLLRNKMVRPAKEGMMHNASSSEVYGKMHEVFIKMDDKRNADSVHKELKDLKDAVIPEGNGAGRVSEVFDPEKHLDAYLPVRVNEQRFSNLLQSLLVAGCVGVMPIIQQIPTSVLWGYFAYMSIDNLPGNQFGERIQLLFIVPNRRYKVLEGAHASFFGVIPQVLVHWSTWPASMATWEDEHELKFQLPDAPAWGQAGPQEGANVSTPPRSPRQAAASKGVALHLKMPEWRSQTEQEGPTRRTKRAQKPNMRILGPEWVYK